MLLASILSLATYMPTYLTNELNFTSTAGILTTLVSLTTYVIILPFVGALADHVGRKPVLIGACLLFIMLSHPVFLLLTLGGIYPVLALIILGAVLAGNMEF